MADDESTMPPSGSARLAKRRRMGPRTVVKVAKPRKLKTRRGPRDYRTRLPMQLGALKGQHRVQLRWFSIADGLLQRAGTSSQINTVNINSIYQPSTVDTHQPLWHDQWQSLYGTYRVYRADYKITIDAASGATPMVATIGEQFAWAYVAKTGAPSMGTTAATNAQVETFCEACPGLRNAHFKWLNPTADESHSSKVVFKGSIKFSDLHDDYADTTNDQSSFGGSPAEPVYLYMGVADPLGTVRTDNIRCAVEVVYHTLLSHPNGVTQN